MRFRVSEINGVDPCANVRRFIEGGVRDIAQTVCGRKRDAHDNCRN